MSLVGNFYSRITAKKMEKHLRLSPIPTITELQAAVKEGKQVQGSEVLVQLGGLRKRVQVHMQNLVVADAIQEIVDVLALVRLGRLPITILKLNCRGSRFTGQQDLLRGATLADIHRPLAPCSTSRNLHRDSQNLRYSPPTFHPGQIRRALGNSRN